MSTTTADDLLSAALDYVQCGWPVLPLHAVRAGHCTCGDRDCDSPGKHPRTIRGLDDATTDAQQIRKWWARWPEANIGGVTGAKSGFLALDFDPRHDSDATFAQLEAEHGTIVTRRTRTGGGGSHLLFGHPGGRVGNRTKLLPGIDVRGDRGYIVLPPSLHRTGRRYEWDGDPKAPIVSTPAWLAGLLAPKPRRAAPVRPAGEVPARYVDAAVRGECERVRSASNGTRNDTLNRAAFNLGQLVGGGVLDRDLVERELLDAAAAYIETDGKRQARATIRSGIENGMKEPRAIPERTESQPGANGSGPAPARLTDLGNAERFASQHCDSLRYCHPWRSWLVWDGRCWTVDRDGAAWRSAEATVRAIYGEVERLENEAERRVLAKHAVQSESHRRLYAMLEIAKADRRLTVLPEQLDARPTRYLFNVLNGTLDLRTGELGSHRSTDLITRCSSIDYDPRARSTLWEKMLERALPDSNVRAFLQRYAGSALTADTGDQSFVICVGPGSNSKTTTIETIAAVLGDYAHRAAFDTLLEATGRSDRRGGARPDLLALRAARLVRACEAGEGRRLDEQLVKQLTGGDEITARGLYHSDQTSFTPECKLLLAVNHRPEILGGDEAIWRRVLEVPFTVTIPLDDRDPTLGDRLREPEHLRAVLAWLVAGCRDWLSPPRGQMRLRPPAPVVASSRAYRSEQDPVAPFLEDECELHRAASTTHKALRERYGKWCENNGLKPLGDKKLGSRLEEKGLHRAPIYHDGKKSRGWIGVGLASELMQQPAGTDRTAERSF